ncbi:MAG TPA: response regulator transcription factor [Actinomycetota bacterium]|nr:response regulator transcription factor [Actinomycetota bacterium]
MERRAAPVGILLAERESLFRETLRHALDRAPGLRVVAVAGDGIGTVREAERARPDVAMVDADLPNGDGVKTTALVKRRVPGCRVVVLADADDEATLIDAVAAGADGFLTRECPLHELIEGVRRVRDEMLIPRHLLRPLITALLRRQGERDRALRLVAGLTRREREVLALLADGADNDEISQALVISPQTARTHVRNLLGKLAFHSRLEAASFVIRNDLRDELPAPALAGGRARIPFRSVGGWGP